MSSASPSPDHFGAELPDLFEAFTPAVPVLASPASLLRPELVQSSVHLSAACADVAEVRVGAECGESQRSQVVFLGGQCTFGLHPAFEAVQFSIQCSRCGHSMDVRELILDDAANHPRISTSIVARLRAATRIGP